MNRQARHKLTICVHDHTCVSVACSCRAAVGVSNGSQRFSCEKPRQEMNNHVMIRDKKSVIVICSNFSECSPRENTHGKFT